MAKPVIAKNETLFDKTLDSVILIKNTAERYKALKGMESMLHVAGSIQFINYDKQVLATAIALGDSAAIIKNHLNLGIDYLNTNQFPEAMAFFYDGLSLATANKDHENEIRFHLGLANVYKNIGERSKDTKEYLKALQFAEAGLTIGRQHQITRYEYALYGQMGTLYDLQGKHDLAIAYMKKCVALCPPGPELVTWKMNYAICLKNNKQHEDALIVYQQAQLLTDSFKIPNGQLLLDDNLAILYNEMGQPDKSEHLALTTLKTATAIRHYGVMMDMNAHLKTLYERMGKSDAALYHANQLLAIKDTVLNQEKTAQMEEMQSKFDADVKDKKIVSQTATIASSKRQQLYMIAGIVILIIVGAVVLISLQRTRRLNQQIELQRTTLQHQKKSLEQANDLKDKLFSVISHDLRTPVNSLLAFTTLLDNDELPQDKARSYMALLRQHLGTTANLLENLLQFAGAQMAEAVPVIESVMLSEVVMEVVDLMQPSLQAKDIRVAIDIKPGTIVTGDANMVALVYRNLISNAIKYSHPGASIYLASEDSGSHIVCTVTDEGVGMPAALVTRFNSQTESKPLESRPGTKNEKGTGLGLLLCDTFVGLMHATITVESHEGKGTIFKITFLRGLIG